MKKTMKVRAYRSHNSEHALLKKVSKKLRITNSEAIRRGITLLAFNTQV